MTNQAFADRVGCHHSLASRIRAGKRVPGYELMRRIGKEFNIPLEELASARDRGPEAFGELMRRRVFRARAA